MSLLTIYILFSYRYRFSISAACLQLHSGKQGTIYHWTEVIEQLYLATKSNGKPWSNWTRERISVFIFTNVNGGPCYNVLCNYMPCTKIIVVRKKGCTVVLIKKNWNDKFLARQRMSKTRITCRLSNWPCSPRQIQNKIDLTKGRFCEPARLSNPHKSLFSLKPLDTKPPLGRSYIVTTVL